MKTADTIEELGEVREVVSSLSEQVRKDSLTLEERAELYGIVNPLAKDLEKMRKSLRDEIVGEVEDVCKKDEKTGKLAAPKRHKLVSETGKGAIVMSGGDVSLELRPKTKEVFNEDKARLVLKKANLLAACEEETIKVKDLKVLAETIHGVLCTLDDHSDSPLLRRIYDDLNDGWNVAVEETTTLSEERIKGLIQAKLLPVEAAIEMFDTQYSYSLYEKQND